MRSFRAGAGGGPVERVRGFFSEGIWEAHVDRVGWARASLYGLARIVCLTVRGFLDNSLTNRAAALTYYSVLSIVPFLAFAFALLKGFGAYRRFVTGTVDPYLRQTFGESPVLLDASRRILQFVDGTDLASVGAVGLVVLFYSSVSLISNVEAALNQVWGVKSGRSLVRKITDYVTLIVTTPLLILAGTTLAATGLSSGAMGFVRETLNLGAVIDLLFRFGSLLTVGLAMFALYVILPNVRTRVLSALLGAVVSALLWETALLLHVRFQVGVAQYNALYSVLSAVPIFLFWTYVSWLVVLIGAQVASAHQNVQLVHQRFLARRVDQAIRETLAVAVMDIVVRDFMAGGARPGAATLAERLCAPRSAVEEILDALVRAGLVAVTQSRPDPSYVPGRDADAVRLEDVRDAMRREPVAEALRVRLDQSIAPELRRLLATLDVERRASRSNVTLRELAAMASRDGAAGRTPASRDVRSPSHSEDLAPDEED